VSLLSAVETLQLTRRCVFIHRTVSIWRAGSSYERLSFCLTLINSSLFTFDCRRPRIRRPPMINFGCGLTCPTCVSSFGIRVDASIGTSLCVPSCQLSSFFLGTSSVVQDILHCRILCRHLPIEHILEYSSRQSHYELCLEGVIVRWPYHSGGVPHHPVIEWHHTFLWLVCCGPELIDSFTHRFAMYEVIIKPHH
jgi:hypothetical protein